MKFSLKVFFATIIIVMLSFSIGGYLLVTSQFRSGLEREINSSLDESRALRFGLETALTGAPAGSPSYIRALLEEIGEPVIVSVSSRDLHYMSVYDAEDVIYAYANLPGEAEEETTYTMYWRNFREELGEGERVYRIWGSSENGRYFVQSVCWLMIGGESYYLQTQRDISDVFTEREHSVKILQRILIFLVIIDGVVALGMSNLLTKPIRRLSRMTRKIAMGQWGDRAQIESRDEIGLLAADFNRMADQVEEHIEELQEVNRRQNDFVASFAHELKTPLTSMIGYADMLRSKEMPAEEQFLAAGYIFSEGKRLEALSLKLLDLIVLQKSDFDFKLLAVPHLFEKLHDFLLPTMQEAKIDFQVEAEEGKLLVEPDLFHTLILNLLDNARKALDEEGGKIRLSGVREGEGYAIYVFDDGRGIPPEDLTKITEPFYMVDKSRARQKGGAGLGLAICAEIVRLHGAQIHFDSQLGRGTLVRLYFGEVRE